MVSCTNFGQAPEEVMMQPGGTGIFIHSTMGIESIHEVLMGCLGCLGCLEASGKKREDLMEGIQVADKEVFFTFTDGGVLTLDY